MQQLLGDCVANANTLPNTVDEIYYCYEMYNKGFKQLKSFIAEESMFYEWYFNDQIWGNSKVHWDRISPTCWSFWTPRLSSPWVIVDWNVPLI